MIDTSGDNFDCSIEDPPSPKNSPTTSNNSPQMPVSNNAITWPAFDYSAFVVVDEICVDSAPADTIGVGEVIQAVAVVVGVVIFAYQNHDAIVQGAEYVGENISNWWDSTFFASEHTKNDNPANLEKHQKGQAANQRNKRGGEKGDSHRPYIPPAHK
jgi:hypothetical protein